MQRQWIGLSLTGDSVTVEPFPTAPASGAPAYIETIDLEVGFLKRGHEIAEQFSADDMARNFIKGLNGIIFAVGEFLVFEYHGQNIKATVKALNILDLSDAQRSGSRAPPNMGVLMDKSDVNLIKAGDSAIKIKSSAKKCVLLYALKQK
jgi:vesicle-fusing ATPase